MMHSLKQTQPYFDDVANGNKPFEVRFADRPYAVGDFLALNEWVNDDYTGKLCVVKITYILRDTKYVKEGYVVLGISLAKVVTAIDPAPSVRGKWLALAFSEDMPYGFICSICHSDVVESKKIHVTDFKFCPNCGAKMEVG